MSAKKKTVQELTERRCPNEHGAGEWSSYGSEFRNIRAADGVGPYNFKKFYATETDSDGLTDSLSSTSPQ